MEQLKKTISKNKNCIWDFTAYGPSRKIPPSGNPLGVITEEALEGSNLKPDVVIHRDNPVKKDKITYMFWGGSV